MYSLNSLQVSLSQQTIEKMLRKVKEATEFNNERADIVKDHEIKNIKFNVYSNVHLSKESDFRSFRLVEPNLLFIDDLTIKFQTLNIVIEIDIPKFEQFIGVITPPIDLNGPLPGGTYDPPDIGKNVSIFKENPDIQLTVGLEEFIQPSFSGGLKVEVRNDNGNYKVYYSPDEQTFKFHGINFSENAAQKIYDNIFEEIKNRIKSSVGNDVLDKVIDALLRNPLDFLPIPDFTNFILDKVLNSEVLRKAIETQITKSFKEKSADIPETVSVGEGDLKTELTIDEAPSVRISGSNLYLDIKLRDI